MRLTFRDIPSDVLGRIGLICLMVVVTIGFASTSNASRGFIEPMRNLAAIGVFMCGLLVLVKSTRLPMAFVRTVSFSAILIVYGLLLAEHHGGIGHVQGSLAVNMGIVYLGFLLIVNVEGRFVTPQAGMALVAYALLVLVLTYGTDGLILEYPPRFNFEYGSQDRYWNLNYSQGVSKFFGLGGILAAFVATVLTNKPLRLMMYGVCAIMILLSLLGGARGDSIAAVLIVFLRLAFHARQAMVASLFLITPVLFTFLSSALSEDFALLQRLNAVTDGNYGYRDVLLGQAWDLLRQEPTCLMTGCGFGYFQTYYKLESGFHPHNIPIEMIIVFGLPLTAVTLGLTLRGMMLYMKQTDLKLDGLMAVFLYFMFIGLKSGTILSSWVIVICMLYFVFLAIDNVGAQLARDRRRQLTA